MPATAGEERGGADRPKNMEENEERGQLYV
jgi:hypothetical protein